MPDIQITDQLDKPIQTVTVDLSNPSSLVKYLKTELLHLAVVPDFLARKDLILSQAATKPIQFQASAQHDFELGTSTPEIDITPAAQAAIHVNATPGSSLSDSDPFHNPATVPAATGYVGLAFQGSLDVDVDGSSGDLSFGVDKTSGIRLEYWKAFPLGVGEPKLGDALAGTLGSFVIPATLSDFAGLAVNDVAAVSGQGSLTVSGGVSVSVYPNPLASANLPLGVGTIAVQPGATAGLSTSFTLSGSYQIRVSRKDAATIELSVLRESGTQFTAGLSASAGIAADLGTTDLIASILGAISKDPSGDKQLLAAIPPDVAAGLAGTIKSGLNHHLQASLNATLSAMTDDQAAFQYEIQPAQLSPDAANAVQSALTGDLSLLTGMEDNIQADGALAPGLKMLNSLMTATRQRGITLKLNLLGILNYISISELIRNSETLTDSVTGDVTIKETVTGNRISAIAVPLDRDEALRKAIFDSIVATTSYRAGKAVALPDLACQQVHFALNQNTNHANMADYLTWMTALNLIGAPDKAALLNQFADGGQSTCVLRTSFGDADCAAMFFDAQGNLRPQQDYLDIGRRAMRALLDPNTQPNDRLRYQIVDDPLWPQALSIGANVNLGPLVGLSTADPRVVYLIGDVMVITQWASAMSQAGALVRDVRAFVGDADPAGLFQNSDFQAKTGALQQKLAAMVKASTIRFDEPWGMVSLFWAAGSPRGARASIHTQKLTVERGAERVVTAGKS